MTYLFERGELRQFLGSAVESAAARIEGLPEDEILSRSVDDMVEEFAADASTEPLTIGDSPVDGGVSETTVDVSRDFMWHGSQARGVRITASYEFRGDARLFQYTPSTRIMSRFAGVVSDGLITVEVVRPGIQQDPEQMRRALDSAMGSIRKMANHANADVEGHNRTIADRVRELVEQRRDRIQKRRALAGALGFPLMHRDNPPRLVPLQRKAIGSARPARQAREPYKDEPALTDAQYEDALAVVRSSMLAMERTPSVASGKSEEDLRDQILVQLNGTFKGAATGETFVQKGKTDILVVVDERHVFVGECKWWTGPKDFSDAIDQLLGYLPWRNEKAALILFIDRKDASRIIGKADDTIRAHSAFKRVGKQSGDPASRRNFVLGHPDDIEREIQTAVMFAVLPKKAPA